MPFGFDLDKPNTPRFWLTLVGAIVVVVAVVWIAIQLQHTGSGYSDQLKRDICDRYNTDCAPGYTRTPRPMPNGSYVVPCKPEQPCVSRTPGH
jgi:hypothetical protein